MLDGGGSRCPPLGGSRLLFRLRPPSPSDLVKEEDGVLPKWDFFSKRLSGRRRRPKIFCVDFFSVLWNLHKLGIVPEDPEFFWKILRDIFGWILRCFLNLIENDRGISSRNIALFFHYVPNTEENFCLAWEFAHILTLQNNVENARILYRILSKNIGARNSRELARIGDLHQ